MWGVLFEWTYKMLQQNSWLLPDGVEEILPGEALHLNRLRQKLLDVFAVWGYELVIPPLIDYLESLLTGTGHDLDLQTFKLTDQLSGELLGVRADMTPLVARIDAHNLGHEWPTRLCYVGTILHTRGDPLEKTRTPMQIGAELYGHAGVDSDVEVISLMLEMLAMSELKNVHLDIGHVGIYRGLSGQAGLDPLVEADLFDVLQRKDRTELVELLNRCEMDDHLKSLFLQLPELHGDHDVLDTAEDALSGANDEVMQALSDLRFLSNKLSTRFPSLPVSFDLGELRGYHYHTGVVFAAFVPEMGREIARGGRYDNIGEVFGRARPATGFSADLKVLSSLSKDNEKITHEKIFAPNVDDVDLLEMIRDLRAKGQTVIQQLPDQSGNELDMGCTSRIEKNGHKWVVTPV